MAKTHSRQEIVDYVSAKSAIINSDAVDLLLKKPDFKSVIDQLLEEKNFVLDRQTIENKIVQTDTKLKPKATVEVNGRKGFHAPAAETEANYRIRDDLNITGQSNSEGKVDDFLHLFRDKFDFLSRLLKRRSSLNIKPLNRIKKVQPRTEVDVIGMVSRKWVSKNGHLCLELEDPDASCIVVLLKDDLKLKKQAERVILDDVIVVRGVKAQSEMLIGKQIVYPDLTPKKNKLASRDLSLCVTSDTHVGSKLFLEKDFSRFIDWLNGRIGDDKEKEKVGKIKYLILAGDNVDGIGVYPEQFNELNIPDIYQQYDAFSELVLQIPDYIEIFICPGQHDAVRRADPQPPVPKEFVPKLAQQKNVHLISSPGWVELEGLKTMVYHGAALHDLYASVSYLDATKPEKAIVDVLQRRSLMVSYGLKQPYIPEKKDFLLIREEPDIYVGGDMHHNGYATYRGTIVINSGTWQDQTAFQVKQGHVPTPGIVPVLNLHTGKITENFFTKKAYA